VSGLRIEVKTESGSQIVNSLDALAARAAHPEMAARTAADWIEAETFRIFSEAANVDGPWEPISKVTAFIRRHRANAPRKGNQPGSDTGRLKGSFRADWNSDGTQFGAGTNVRYAQKFNDGGASDSNIVAIRGFKRKNMRKKTVDYLMHMQSGHAIPPRQFYPSGMSELQSWGYLDEIKDIFRKDFDSLINGGAA
jgi:phage gpG-like protein